MKRHASPFSLSEAELLADGSLGQPGVKVALIDERKFIRDCIASAIEDADAEIQVFGFSTTEEIFLSDLSLAIVWIESPGSQGVTELERRVQEIRENFPGCAVAAFVGDSDRVVVSYAIGHGVSVVGSAKTTKEIATAAVRLACAGGIFTVCELSSEDKAQEERVAPVMDAGLGIKVINGLVSDAFSQAMAPACIASAAASASVWQFTHREREVLDHLTRGLQNKNIAFALGISDSTVKVHLRNIMKKLNATNRTQVLFLMRQMPHSAHVPHL